MSVLYGSLCRKETVERESLFREDLSLEIAIVRSHYQAILVKTLWA
jgi:hypothetical protein